MKHVTKSGPRLAALLRSSLPNGQLKRLKVKGQWIELAEAWRFLEHKAGGGVKDERAIGLVKRDFGTPRAHERFAHAVLRADPGVAA